MIKLIIDSREKNLYNNIKERDLDIYKNNINIEYLSLELGDIKIIIYDNDEIIRELVFERKTLNDLNSSLYDGRYKEQKNRLLSNIAINNLTYIIEGDTISKSINRNSKNISSVYIHTLYRDDIRIIFTDNLFETTNFILTLCSKIIDKPENFYNSNKNTDYLNCIKIKSKKIENITPDNCFILQLIILLVIFYNSDFTAIIGVIGIIVFIIISILYFTRILRIVRTDNKKKYWQKPLKSDLKKL